MSSDESMQVVILDDRRNRPIYHLRHDGRLQWYTRCGSSIGFWSAYLRRDHASMFAVPCKRCFPR